MRSEPTWHLFSAHDLDTDSCRLGPAPFPEPPLLKPPGRSRNPVSPPVRGAWTPGEEILDRPDFNVDAPYCRSIWDTAGCTTAADSAPGRDGALGTEYLPDRDRRHQRGSGRACLRPGAALSPGLFRGSGSPVQRPGSGGEFHPDESARRGSPNLHPDSGRTGGTGGRSGFRFSPGLPAPPAHWTFKAGICWNTNPPERSTRSFP